ELKLLNRVDAPLTVRSGTRRPFARCCSGRRRGGRRATALPSGSRPVGGTQFRARGWSRRSRRRTARAWRGAVGRTARGGRSPAGLQPSWGLFIGPMRMYNAVSPGTARGPACGNDPRASITIPRVNAESPVERERGDATPFDDLNQLLVELVV